MKRYDCYKIKKTLENKSILFGGVVFFLLSMLILFWYGSKLFKLNLTNFLKNELTTTRLSCKCL